VAGGSRAKQRRLAEALLANPSVLHDGRSPAPRVVSELLIALTDTGTANRVHSRTADLRRLAWTVEERPELLTGDGAHAPAADVLRLIQHLRDAGAQTIIQPTCPGCGRTVGLVGRLTGLWHCQRCVRTAGGESVARQGVEEFRGE
jgi:hypothetical protein